MSARSPPSPALSLGWPVSAGCVGLPTSHADYPAPASPPRLARSADDDGLRGKRLYPILKVRGLAHNSQECAIHCPSIDQLFFLPAAWPGWKTVTVLRTEPKLGIPTFLPSSLLATQLRCAQQGALPRNPTTNPESPLPQSPRGHCW
ncbi:hypothetical protein HJG60_011926 [Phyllostomus discolor]|uniref:Uncharacterized protein n=1 Tax=Phyllostomus discolor TaxID=89673 RepID=A0A833ZPN4_9CHIR|nr:hypothetical protein HJG60_011926 [Phyllostomus discolor]